MWWDCVVDKDKDWVFCLAGPGPGDDDDDDENSDDDADNKYCTGIERSVWCLRPKHCPWHCSALLELHFNGDSTAVMMVGCFTRSLGALRAPTSSWWPFGLALGPSGLLDFVLRALRALSLCDPCRCVHDSCIRDSDCCIHKLYPWCMYPWCMYPRCMCPWCMYPQYMHPQYMYPRCMCPWCTNSAAQKIQKLSESPATAFSANNLAENPQKLAESGLQGLLLFHTSRSVPMLAEATWNTKPKLLFLWLTSQLVWWKQADQLTRNLC